MGSTRLTRGFAIFCFSLWFLCYFMQINPQTFVNASSAKDHHKHHTEVKKLSEADIKFATGPMSVVATYLEKITTKDEHHEEGEEASNTVNFRVLPDDEFRDWCYAEFKLHSVYHVGNRLFCNDNAKSFSVAVMIAVIVTICLEFVIHYTEHMALSAVAREIVNKVHRELMIMGFISFSISVIESTPLFKMALNLIPNQRYEESSHEMVERRIKMFELGHVILFGFAMFFVVVVVISFNTIKSVWKRWKRYDELSEKKAMTRFVLLKEKLKRNKFQLLNPFFLYQLANAAELCNYWAMKLRFLALYDLPKDFAFGYYLKRRMQRLFIDMTEIHVWVWLCACAVSLVMLLKLVILPLPNIADHMLWIFVGVLGWGSCIVFGFVFAWIRIAYSIYIQSNSLPKQLHRLKALEEKHQQQLELQEVEEDTMSETSSVVSEMTPMQKKESKVWVNKYFLFFSPFVTFLLIQLCLFAQCVYASMLVVHYQSVFLETGFITFTNLSYVKLLLMLPLFASTLVVTLCFFPWTVTPFVILSSVDNLASKDALKMVLFLKDKPKFYYKVHSCSHEHYFEAGGHHHHSYVDQLYMAEGVNVPKFVDYNHHHHSEEEEEEEHHHHHQVVSH